MLPWLEAFLLTQLIEIPIYRLLLKCRYTTAFGASLITHPVVWFVIPWIWHWNNYAVYFIIAESFAVIVEALYFRSLGFRRVWTASLAANATSASLGLLKYYILG